MSLKKKRTWLYKENKNKKRKKKKTKNFDDDHYSSFFKYTS